MVEAIVKKIMLNGIRNFEKKYNVPQVQIKVTNDVDGFVFYDICINFKSVERVTFLQIMDKKMDLLGYQALANPFMKKSLELYAKEHNEDLSNVCAFIIEVNNNIGLAFYHAYKNGKSVSLKKHLEDLGLS